MNDSQRIDQLFLAAVELPLVERSAFLQANCGGDGLLQMEVESLLAADGDNEAVIEAGQLGRAPRIGKGDGIAEDARSGQGDVHLRAGFEFALCDDKPQPGHVLPPGGLHELTARHHAERESCVDK